MIIYDNKVIAEAMDVLHTNYPELKHIKFEPVPAHQHDSVVLLSKDLAFKYIPDVVVEKYGEKYFCDAMWRDAVSLNIFKRINFQGVPKLIDYSGDLRYYLASRIKGKKLSPGMDSEYAKLGQMPSHAQRKIGQQLGQFLARLHSLDVEDFANVPVFKARGGALSLKPNESEMSTLISLGLVHHKIYDLAIQEIVENPGDPLVLVHRDLHPANVFIRELKGSRIDVNVIDWGNANVTRLPHIDFAHLITFYPPGFWQPAIETYNQLAPRVLDVDKLEISLAKMFVNRTYLHSIGHYSSDYSQPVYRTTRLPHASAASANNDKNRGPSL